MKSEKNKPLEILIVEDREENRKAAMEYFSTISSVSIDFATTYEEGMRKIGEKVYAFGIFDMELPRTEGSKPEKLGYELVDKAAEYLLPWAVITSGIDHHKCKSAFLLFPWMDRKEPVESWGFGFGQFKMTETPKTSPNAWKTVYELLSRMYEDNIDELVKAKERQKNYGMWPPKSSINIYKRKE